MESDIDNPPLIVIVGPTGSGKTSLAIKLASQCNGEIICADSRTIYKGMNIGTAKPSPKERAAVLHHLLDIANPNRPITVADFKRLATKAIDDVRSRGKVPFLVGGTGLYIDAVIFNFSFRGKPDLGLRQELERLEVEELQDRVVAAGLVLPQNSQNKRHLIRVIESGGEIGASRQLLWNALIIGIDVNKEELGRRLATSIDKMFNDGLENEVRGLVRTYGWDCQALQSIGYQEFRPYFEGECTQEEVRQMVLRHSMQYAKRQKTWFKRNKRIHYIYKTEDSVDLVTTFLNKKV